MPLLKDLPEMPSKPLREIIYDHLRRAIIHGDLQSDTWFTDMDIAAEMGVSRTPVRDAVQKLERDCLLYTSPSPRDRQKSRMPSSA